MIISESSLQFHSEHSNSTTLNVKEDLRMWVDTPQLPEADDRVSLSSSSIMKYNEKSDDLEKNLDPRLLLFIRLLEALTGKKIKLQDYEEIVGANGNGVDTAGIPDPGQAQREGWGAVYTRSETLTESEQVAIRASGTVTTADGTSIDLSLNVSMSREYVAQTNLTIRQGDPERVVDPLVINLDGNPVTLTNVRYSFDLDADGVKEEIPFVSQGSGLLALDRNGDGKIQDGTELFGPSTGNGFSELAKLDEDKNGWIDENDSFFSKLSIWIKNADGKDNFRTLKDAGVGALALASIQANFSFKNEQNDTLGMLRQGGLYLTENGGVGSMLQIDLAV